MRIRTLQLPGALVIISIIAVIGLGLYWTKNPNCLWAIVPLLWMGDEFLTVTSDCPQVVPEDNTEDEDDEV